MSQKKPTFLALRLRTGMTRKQFAKYSGVAIETLNRIENGLGVRAISAQRAINALNAINGTQYDAEDFQDIVVSRL